MKRLMSLAVFLVITLSCCTNDEMTGYTGALDQISSDVPTLTKEELEWVDPKTVYPFP